MVLIINVQVYLIKRCINFSDNSRFLFNALQLARTRWHLLSVIIRCVIVTIEEAQMTQRDI